MAISPSCEYIAQLSSVKGLGLKTFYHLYQYFGSISALRDANYETLTEAGLKLSIARALDGLNTQIERSKVPPAMEQQILWSEQDGNHLLCIEDALYPPLLREVYCPPPLIYVKGNLASLALPSIAMVGSRKPSIAGKQHAYHFARDLSFQGYNIVSGLALGVDTQSHKGALSASGITCAVLGTGLDIVYPRQNKQLAEQIIEQGVLVSEMALGSLPVPSNFPRRNRLISGLSRGSLIVEAGLKSGSLITASYAIEQNRDVFVIPGPIDSDVAAGCNELIKQGAQLVSCVDDIVGAPMSDLGSFTGVKPADDTIRKPPQNKMQTVNSEKREISGVSSVEGSLPVIEAKILSLLDFQCTSFDVLTNESELEAGVVLQSLVSLELKGLISNVPGGYQRVKSVNSTLRV